MKRLIFSALFLFSLAAYADNSQITVISDIHFNPFADCNKRGKCELVLKLNQAPETQWPKILAQYSQNKLSAPHEETNYVLFQRLLQQLQEQQPNHLLILGDFLAHRFHSLYVYYSHDKNTSHYQQFTIKTIQYITDSIQKALPNTDIYPLIGNNDSYAGRGCAYSDYCVIANGGFYKELSGVWSKLFKSEANQQSFLGSFAHAGYYDIVLPNSHNHIIVLNTVIFSNKAQGPDIDQEAKKQLQWLQDKLSAIAAANEKTWIIYHIPPGIDAYSTTKNIFNVVAPFWENDYSKIFYKLVHQYKDQITGVVSGHLHMDGFLLLDVNSSGNYIIDTFVPSISPIFGNNPAYKIYTYTPDEFKLHNFSAYYLDLKAAQPAWQKEYDFSKTYQPKDGLSTGYQKVTVDRHNTFTANYIQFYAVNTESQPITGGKWQNYWCATRYLESKPYQTCLKETR
ncbi:MAG: metallophosphoesterase [Proteobacteria bacterium]|nr:metallophosphoesterase [Pseudomonadota bacterium]